MDLLNRAKKLKAEGKSYEQIGKALGITKSAAYRLLQNQTENVADSDFDDDFDTETVEKSQNKSISSKKSDKESELRLAYKLKKLELRHAKEMREMELKDESRRRGLEREVNDLEEEAETLRAEIDKLTRQMSAKSRPTVSEDKDDEDEESDENEDGFVFQERIVLDYTPKKPSETPRNETFQTSETVETIDYEEETPTLPERLQTAFNEFVSDILEKQGEDLYRSDYAELSENLENLRKKFKKFAEKNPFTTDDIPHYAALKKLKKFVSQNIETMSGGWLFGTYREFILPDKLTENLTSLTL